MPYYSNTPLLQNYNTSTQQNRITPMLQYVIITLHQTPDFIGISAPIICPRQRKVVPLYQRGHPSASDWQPRPQGESMRTGIASCAFVATKPSDGVS